MQAAAGLGLAPFAPYHWIMYSRSMWFDIEHAQVELGWQPQYSNDEMFAASYDWFLAHRADTVDARRLAPSHDGQAGRLSGESAMKAALRLLPG